MAPNVELFGGLLVENVIPHEQTGLSSFFVRAFAPRRSLCFLLGAFTPLFLLLGINLKKEPMEALNTAQGTRPFACELQPKKEADRSETKVEKPGPVNLEMPIPSPSKRKQPLDQKEEEKQLSERGNNGRSSKSSPKGKENTCPSREAKVPSQKRSGQSWAVSSCGLHKRSDKLEEKRRARPSPSGERGRGQPGSTHRRDSSHTKLHVKDRRPQLRSPVRILKRRPSGDSSGAPYNSAKRRRHPSPEARSFPTFSLLMSRVFTNMGALQVALDDLQTPGGAFLRGPSSSAEPTVSQRAWLMWQLSHAGAALHWALHTVNSILAAQASLPRYTWPQGDSFTADPRPVPTSCPLPSTQARQVAQRPGDSTSPNPSVDARILGPSRAGQRDQHALSPQ
nr:uncharacterized protein LOC120103073 [Rattus norvegicus]